MNTNPDDLSNSLNDALSTLGIDTTHSQTVHDHNNQFNTLDHSQNNGLHSFDTNPLDTTHLNQHQPESWSTNQAIFHSDPNTTSTSPSSDDWNPHHHFDPNHLHGTVIGNPAHEMKHWHEQESPASCGIASQQFAIEHLTHKQYTEGQLSQYAQTHGWFDPNGGTTPENFGKLIENIAHVPVEHHFGGTISEIASKLQHGEEVFVGVNSNIEWMPDRNSVLGQVAPNLFDPHHFAGQPANHVVQVIGIEVDPHNPQHSYVIVNDPGTPDGRGVEIPIDQFKLAMDASHGFIASTAIHGENPLMASQNSGTEEMTFGCKINTVIGQNVILNEGGTRIGHYNGNSFYWNNNSIAGTWDCNGCHAYTRNGVDLGYARTWHYAAQLIYSQG